MTKKQAGLAFNVCIAIILVALTAKAAAYVAVGVAGYILYKGLK